MVPEIVVYGPVEPGRQGLLGELLAAGALLCGAGVDLARPGGVLVHSGQLEIRRVRER